MSKIGKVIAFVGVAGAAVAGLWYFLDNRNKQLFDEFEEDDEECCKCDKEEKEERAYVSLDPAAETAKEEASEEDKEALKKAVTKAIKDSVAKSEEEAAGVGVVKEDEVANDFEFKSFDEDKED